VSAEKPPKSLAGRVERLMRGGSPVGPADWLLAGALRTLQPLYALGAGYNNWRANSGRLDIAPVPEGVRVVSVGNLTLGGSGKTPLTLALAEEFLRRNRRVAVVLRGHGGQAAKEGRTAIVATPGEAFDPAALDPTEAGDEATLYAMRLSGRAGVIVSRKRSAGVALAAEQWGCDAILLDDGFQHRKQARSADLLLLDASLPKAAYRLCPRGYLREPLRNAKRATAIAIEAESEPEAREKASRLGLAWGDEQSAVLYRRSLAGTWRCPNADDGPQPPPNELEPFSSLEGRGFWFAGIAHPERFADGLKRKGLDLVGGAPLADHEPFSDAALAKLAQDAGQSGASYVIATEKDAAKLLGRWPADAPTLYVARLEARLTDPDAWAAHCLG
jgi:tetraacyldisaccharide 4'-kinase